MTEAWTPASCGAAFESAQWLDQGRSRRVGWASRMGDARDGRKSMRKSLPGCALKITAAGWLHGLVGCVVTQTTFLIGRAPKRDARARDCETLRAVSCLLHLAFAIQTDVPDGRGFILPDAAASKPNMCHTAKNVSKGNPQRTNRPPLPALLQSQQRRRARRGKPALKAKAV